MNLDLPALLAASLLRAVPSPLAPSRGRYAFPREDRAHGRRLARAERPIRLLATDPAGPRAERRALASPSVRPPRLTLAERAAFARYRARVALAACAAREAR